MISDRLQVQRPQMSQGYDWLVNQRSQELLNKFKKPVERVVDQVGEQLQGGKEAIERFAGGILPTQAPVTQTFNNYNPALYKGITKDMRNKGVDFGVKEGTPVSLPDGNWIVKEASTNNGFNRGYGNSVMVENEETGERMRMSHLSRVNVLPGQKIRGGSLVGLSGATGNVTGPHLDLEFYDGQGRIGDVTKSRYGQQLFGQGGGGSETLQKVSNFAEKVNKAVLLPIGKPIVDKFIYDDQTGRVLPSSPLYLQADTRQIREQYGDEAAKNYNMQRTGDYIANIALGQGMINQNASTNITAQSRAAAVQQEAIKRAAKQAKIAQRGSIGDLRQQAGASRYGAPRAGTGEQLLEQATGWNPGSKAQFDYAMLTNDKATVKKMLPGVPTEYKVKFADKILSITGGK